MIATKIRNRVKQIPSACPMVLSAFRYKQNASLDVAWPPDLPLANPAAKRGSRKIILVAKNRKYRWTSQRDSFSHPTRLVVERNKRERG